MTVMKWKRATLVAMVCLGIMFPQSALLAGPESPAAARQVIQVADIALAEDGVLNGNVVNEQGEGIADTTVSVRFNQKDVAKVKTDQNGRFQVKNLRAGQHLIVSGKEAAVVRFWAADSAPPKSRDSVLLVKGSPVVRAQLGGLSMVDLVVVGLAGAALGVAIDNNDKIKDVQDAVNQLPSSP